MDNNQAANQNELEMGERPKPHSELESPIIPYPTFSHPDHQMKNNVVLEIEAMLGKIEGPSSSTRTSCICKVPHDIRGQNEGAYTPKVVSIGPLHCNNQTLQNMNKQKLILFKKFTQKTETTLDNLVSFVEIREPRVRACYLESIMLPKEEFVKLVLIDASFIIALFLLEHDYHWLEEDSYLRQPQLMVNITLDLLLLENQLPFFIVDELFKFVFPPCIRCIVPSFIELTLNFFSDFNSHRLSPEPEIRIKHFTDLLRMFHLPRLKDVQLSITASRYQNLLHSISAHSLFQAGVKFKGSRGKCLLDLKFSRGVLEIPRILVDKSIETLFRNMIALEEFKYAHETYISDYAFVLDRLIDTSIDVDVLIEAKIIDNNLGGSDDVARLFNGLGQSISQLNLNGHYLHICMQLNKFCKDPFEHFQNPYKYMMFTLRRYFALASIAGILLFILTLVQTIFTIIK